MIMNARLGRMGTEKSQPILMFIPNITIPGLDIIHCPLLYLKQNVQKIGFCLHLQVEPIQLGSIDRASLCL
jgi:hypothetical protein